MRQNAKKEVERAEIALQRVRAKAAALLAPELPKQSTYVYRILRHRDSGVRVRVLDTQAPDAPAGLFDLPLRFVVECETHGGPPQSYATPGAAMGAARRSYEWCGGCAQVMGPRPAEGSRPRSHAERRRRMRGQPHGAAHGPEHGSGHGLHLPDLHRPGHGGHERARDDRADDGKE
ncbi:hypothetical protein [Actinospica robiniae]|uniref:hypothetical protein n=1 Tax=Actinospica robiniae TaxID=304901 RepID=UPI000415CC8A|nr:hypothetical protein [Actinospica robiniae]